MGLEMTRREVDDEALTFAEPDVLQFCGQDLDGANSARIWLAG